MLNPLIILPFQFYVQNNNQIFYFGIQQVTTNIKLLVCWQTLKKTISRIPELNHYKTSYPLEDYFVNHEKHREQMLIDTSYFLDYQHWHHFHEQIQNVLAKETLL